MGEGELFILHKHLSRMTKLTTPHNVLLETHVSLLQLKIAKMNSVINKTPRYHLPIP